METKKSLMIIIALVALVVISIFLNKNQDNSYLNQDILDGIMYDYNFLTGNSVEMTQEYFEELKRNTSNYSVNTLKELGVYGNDSEKVVLQIQAHYLELTSDISAEVKEELDKYLLENSLKYYFENIESGENNYY